MEVVIGDRIGMYINGHLIYLGMTETALCEALGQPTRINKSFSVYDERFTMQGNYKVDMIKAPNGVKYIACIVVAARETKISSEYYYNGDIFGIKYGDNYDVQSERMYEVQGAYDAIESGISRTAVSPYYQNTGFGVHLSRYYNAEGYVGGHDKDVNIGFSKGNNNIIDWVTVSYNGMLQ